MQRLAPLWREPPLALRPVPAALELPLTPSSRLRKAGRALFAGLLCYAAELLWRGHGAVATIVLLLAAAGVGEWRLQRALASRAQRLRIAADGRVYLIASEGAAEEWQLAPYSLTLGPHLLLVLQAARRRRRLLLGPDNLTPVELAALRRRLACGTAHRATALHSPPAIGRHSKDPAVNSISVSASRTAPGELFAHPGVHGKGMPGDRQAGGAREC